MKHHSSHAFVWGLAWLCLFLSIPLRLYFFSGYSLVDDINFVNTPLAFWETGTLNFKDQQTSRLMILIPQIVVFGWMAVNDFSFILPTFLFAIATHALSLFFVRDLLNERAAFFTSLFFLVSPFETLASTTFVPSYAIAFFTIICAWCVYRGLQSSSKFVMFVGGVFLGCTFLAKFSAVLILPIVGLAALVTRRSWKGWLFLVWGSFSWY